MISSTLGLYLPLEKESLGKAVRCIMIQRIVQEADYCLLLCGTECLGLCFPYFRRTVCFHLEKSAKLRRMFDL